MLKSITFPKLINCAQEHYLHGINDLPGYKYKLDAWLLSVQIPNESSYP